jgi:DNA-binding beta-propeller fold protein YncE
MPALTPLANTLFGNHHLTPAGATTPEQSPLVGPATPSLVLATKSRFRRLRVSRAFAQDPTAAEAPGTRASTQSQSDSSAQRASGEHLCRSSRRFMSKNPPSPNLQSRSDSSWGLGDGPAANLQSPPAGTACAAESPARGHRRHPLSGRVVPRLSLLLATSAAALLLAAGPAAAAEPHPFLSSFGRSATESFTDPNGIAVDEATGSVYVADIAGANEQQTVSLEGEPSGGSFALEFEGQRTSALAIGAEAPSAAEVESVLAELSTIAAGNVSVTASGSLPETVAYTISFQGSLAASNLASLICDGSALSGTSPACTVATPTQGVENSVYRFDSAGNPANFSALATNQLTGSATPAASFSFPNVPDNPAALAVDNSCAQQSPPKTGSACEAFDPSYGDLYVLDAGHGVIDKFAPSGAYLNQLAGPFSGELLGLGVDRAGNLRVGVRGGSGTALTEVFDNSLANSFVTVLSNADNPANGAGPAEYGFATGGQPVRDYALFSCGCIGATGRFGEPLGHIDPASAAAAASVDPATGHLYLDEGSSLTEWDTGQMNGKRETPEARPGALLSTFGSAQLSPSNGRGGIAVDGDAGRIYASNPADGRVYVFATTVAAAIAAPATAVTKTEATLHAIVNPKGTELASCQFEYGTGSSNNLYIPLANLDHTVPCDQTPAQIGTGTEPVEVSAHLTGLQPGSLYRFRLVATNPDGAAPSSGLFPTAAPPFGIREFEVAFLNQDGTPDTQAGSHPYKQIVNIEFNTQVIWRGSHDQRYIAMPAGNVKDISVDLPPGFFGDPNATAKKCTLAQLSSSFEGNCPPESAVGTLSAEVDVGTVLPDGSQKIYTGGLLSIVPPHGVAFQLAAHILFPNAFIDVGLPPGRDSRLSAVSLGIPPFAPLFRSLLTIYGVPPNGATRPLLTMPTACSGPLTSRISADSYQEPGHFATATSVTRNAAGAPAGMTGCAKLFFPPVITGAADVSDANSPTGLTAGVHISQKAALNPAGLAEANLRDVTVTLPEGVTLNPGGADGVEGCTEAQAGFTGFTEFNPELEPGDQTATFTPDLPEPLQPGANFCPDGSKIGTAQVRTPLLDNPIEGSIYLATPYQNPFGSLLAIYAIGEDPISGTIVKQVGQVTADPKTGQLVTTFHNAPNDPFEDFTVHFFGGNRAPLVTPALCGTYTSHALFTPWTGNGPVDSTTSFTIDHGQNGGPCPSGGAPPFHPNLNAGARSNAAGSYSPLDLELTRGDSEQEFTHFSVKLPPGLAGKIAGIPECSDAAIAAAKARTGAHGGQEEEEHPSCPAASEVGHTLVGAGVGSVLVWVPGKLYLAGPYHGSPLSVVSITAARAGAFDFGTVVVRQALRINPETAEVFVDATGSDPLPHIIKGVPTHLRKIEIYLDRPGFIFNPTSCEPTSIASTVLGSGASFTSEADDVPVVASSFFQVANCALLPFKPKLKLSLKGASKRTGNPAFKALLTMKPGEANIARSVVTLPRSEFLDNSHIRTVCTKSVYNQGTVPGENCPAGSIYGRARAISPILDEVLEGPVFLRTPGGKLPDLVAALHSQKVDITLVGHVDSVRSKTKSGEVFSRIRNTFAAVPDAPVSSFVLEMQGGKKGLLENSTNLCRGTHRAEVEFTGHNGKQANSLPAVSASCGKHKAGKRHSHRAAR